MLQQEHKQKDVNVEGTKCLIYCKTLKIKAKELLNAVKIAGVEINQKNKKIN